MAATSDGGPTTEHTNGKETPTNELLRDTLLVIESRAEPFSEYEVSDAVQRLRDKDDVSPKPMKWFAEVVAFDFMEDYQEKESCWGTHFGPSMVGANKDGSRWESPSIRMVTPEMLDYWAMRAWRGVWIAYRDALKWIHEEAAAIPISEETILQLHRMARGQIRDAGCYKEKDGDIIERFADGRERVRFKTVPAARTPDAMKETLALWDECLKDRWVHPLIALAAFNLDFLCVQRRRRRPCGVGLTPSTPEFLRGSSAPQAARAVSQ